MDNGHYHPTEMISDKISSLLLFNEKIALHVTRAVRWDSDHVVIFDDETKEIAKEIVRNDAIDRVFIATDYFDASINRISAWVTGVRNVQKSLLFALLQPDFKMKELQDKNDFTEIMYLSEEMKTMPLGDVWDEFLTREKVPKNYLSEVRKYESEVLSKR
jgi:L-rhamnose isomerase